jgi:hypothetical protein
MTIRTRNVTGRRDVHYASYEEVIRDVDHLIAGHRTLGNWSLGQICRHLAASIDVMLDGAPAALPKPVQFLVRKFLKNRILHQPLPAGYQLPRAAAALLPEPISEAEGAALLRTAVSRLSSTTDRAPHPALGRVSQQDWDAFQLRHCELHLSFVIEEPSPGAAAESGV